MFFYYFFYLLVVVSCGYPPQKTILLDDKNLSNYFKTGDKVVIGERTNSQIIQVTMPSDNSWYYFLRFNDYYFSLFHAIKFLLDKNAMIDDLRKLVAATIMSDPELYSDSYLGMSNENYCSNILNVAAWGGMIILFNCFDLKERLKS